MTRKVVIDGSGPFGLAIKDETGETLPVFSLTITAGPNNFVKAQAEIAVQRVEKVGAEAEFLYMGRVVKSIEFENGEVEEF